MLFIYFLLAAVSITYIKSDFIWFGELDMFIQVYGTLMNFESIFHEFNFKYFFFGICETVSIFAT